MSASLSESGSLELSTTQEPRPVRKPTDGAYAVVRPVATGIPPCLHWTVLPALRPSAQRLGPLLPTPLHHRVYLHQRSRRRWPLVPLPPLLQSGRQPYAAAIASRINRLVRF